MDGFSLLKSKNARIKSKKLTNSLIDFLSSNHVATRATWFTHAGGRAEPAAIPGGS
jgi:hypothetical protein